ncbi:DNA replication/repair protein RecF [candidate division KSB1 bacterium]
MILKSLFGKNFRNFDNFYVEFSDTGNLVFGKNGSGKTNLLEAIHYLSIFKSFRSYKSHNSIRFNQKGFELKGGFENNGNKMKIDFTNGFDKKEVVLNEKRIYRLSDVIGEFPAVLVSPEQYVITSGPPDARRRFIDVLLSQIDKDYLHSLIKYKKILKQRNEALKNPNAKLDSTFISSWDLELAQYCSIILRKRIDSIDKLNGFSREIYKEISNSSDDLKLSYFSSIRDNQDIESINRSYSKNLKRDIELYTTTIGPHRDDIKIELKGKNVKDFASQGEHKTVLLSLKVAEYYLLREVKKSSPAILMDDMSSMLDKSRLKSFLDLFQNFGQYFITSVEKDDFKPDINGLALKINDGNILVN